MEEGRLVVVGGSAAGMSAAARAKKRRPGWEVVVLERGPYVSYGACGIPYYISGEVKGPEEVVVLTPERAKEERGIEVLVRHEVVEVQPTKKLVIALDLETSKEKAFRYDKLVLAVGGAPRVPDIPGVDLEGVFKLRDLQDGIRLRRYLDEEKPKRAVVVGGGYVGLEMASAFRRRGIRVTVVEQTGQVLVMLDPDMASLVEEELAKREIQVVKSAEVVRLEGDQDGRFCAVHLRDRVERYWADFALLAVGVVPEVGLARSCGVALGPTGAISVSPKMETNVPDIYAAGDCAEARHIVTGRPSYIPLGTTANKQGRVAGENAVGGFGVFRGVVGTMVAKIGDLEVARTGLSTREAEDAGFQVVSKSITSRSRAGYYPGGYPLTVKLIAERTSGRLLGAQLVGREGAALRVNIFAAALYTRMTVEDLAQLDLGYAPPFSPVWDPVLVAANETLKLLR